MARTSAFRAAFVVVTAAAVLATCSSSGKSSSSAPTTVAATTTASAPATTVAAPATTSASGPTTTGASAGAPQAAYIRKVDPAAKTITFAPIEYLTGDAARQAWRQANPTAVDGPPNDYYVKNTTTQTQTLAVAADANLHHLANIDDPSSNATATLAVLAADPNLQHEIFFLTIANGQIIATRQQFTP